MIKIKLILKRLKNVWVMLVKYWNWKKFIIYIVNNRYEDEIKDKVSIWLWKEK